MGEESGAWPEGEAPSLDASVALSDQATEWDVVSCFRLLLGRLPSAEEFDLHRYQIGRPLNEVVSEFADSEEFVDRRHVLISRQRLEDDEPLRSLATKDDVFACFRLLLGRLPGRLEFDEHCSAVGSPLSEVVSQFVSSPEFADRGLSGMRRLRSLVKQLDGFEMHIAPDDPVIGRQLNEAGNYEPEVSGVFRRLLIPGMRVLDIGANIGFYSMLAASRVGEAGRVWAIEPNPHNVAFLLANRRLNGFQNLEIVQAAASDRWEVLQYFSAASNGITRPVTEGDPETSGDTVQAVPAAAILPKGERVDLVKIDVEGAEGKVLLGLEPVLRKYRPTIFSEFTPSTMSTRSAMSGEEYLAFLHALDYDLTVLSAGGNVDCGQDSAQVMSMVADLGSFHVDLLARPRQSAAWWRHPMRPGGMLRKFRRFAIPIWE